MRLTWYKSGYFGASNWNLFDDGKMVGHLHPAVITIREFRRRNGATVWFYATRYWVVLHATGEIFPLRYRKRAQLMLERAHVKLVCQRIAKALGDMR